MDAMALTQEMMGGPITRLRLMTHRIAVHLVEVVRDMATYGASRRFTRKFKREGYAIPLGILKSILMLGSDPLRAAHELEEARTNAEIISRMLKSTRLNLTAPQEKVAALLEELIVIDDLIEAVLREYGPGR